MGSRGTRAGLGALAAVLCAASAAQAAAPPFPPSFLLESTEQLAVPGYAAPTAVTQHGDLFTGWTELAFALGDGGSSFDPRSMTREDGRLPLVKMFRANGDILYRLSTFETELAGVPVTYARITATNTGTKQLRARVTAFTRSSGANLGPRIRRCCIRTFRFVRPATPARDGLFFQPGEAFNRASVYAFAGDDLLRDNKVLLLNPPGAALRTLRPGPATAPVAPMTRFGQSRYDLQLAKGESANLDFVLPVMPLDPADPRLATIRGVSYDAARGAMRGAWIKRLAPAMVLELPEKKVVDTFYASLVSELMSRYQLPDGSWVQAVNDLRYHAFWLRDAAFMTYAYDLVGLHQPADENLRWFPYWQRDDGLFISRDQEFDGFGQALWMFGEHVRRAGSLDFANFVYPYVKKAMAWFEDERTKDPLGLMPAAAVADNELVTGHITGDNFLAALGIDGAVTVARAVGDNAMADHWTAVRSDYGQRLIAEVRKAAAANGGAIPPALDTSGGQAWGNLWGAYPAPGLLNPGDPLVLKTLERVRRTFKEGIATYLDGALLHTYIGFRVFETELLLGRQEKVVDGLYASLAHTSASNGTFEAVVSPFGDRIADDSTVPHGWFAAEYVTLVRNMLVREDGNNLILLGALSPSWLEPGKRVRAGRVPTPRGSVNVTLDSKQGGATLRWDIPGLAAGTRLSMPAPYGVSDLKAKGYSKKTGKIALTGKSGTLQLTWTLKPGVRPSYAKAYTDLMAAYLRSPFGAVARRRAFTARARAAALLAAARRTEGYETALNRSAIFDQSTTFQTASR